MQSKTRLQQVSVKIFLAERSLQTWLRKKAPALMIWLEKLDQTLRRIIKPYAQLPDDLRHLHPAIPLILAGAITIVLVWLLR